MTQDSRRIVISVIWILVRMTVSVVPDRGLFQQIGKMPPLSYLSRAEMLKTLPHCA